MLNIGPNLSGLHLISGCLHLYSAVPLGRNQLPGGNPRQMPLGYCPMSLRNIILRRWRVVLKSFFFWCPRPLFHLPFAGTPRRRDTTRGVFTAGTLVALAVQI
jgi:hypothetical protein